MHRAWTILNFMRRIQEAIALNYAIPFRLIDQPVQVIDREPM